MNPKPSLPDHFSLLSAQKGPDHDQEAHESLGSSLRLNGFRPIEVRGAYNGTKEAAWLVPHTGLPESHKAIEGLGRQFNQESVLHSSRLTNLLVSPDGSTVAQGRGVEFGDYQDNYTQLASGHKFKLQLDFSKSEKYEKANQKAAKQTADEAKPHHYGTLDGVHVFRATHGSQSSIPAAHLYDPSDRDLKEAVDKAKKSGQSVFVHGLEPSSLRPRLGPAGPVLKKSFLQGDGTTATNEEVHLEALRANSPDLSAWASSHLSTLPKDSITELMLDGRTIKVRKVDADLYSGWIEENGIVGHKMYRLTLPELVSQLQSKLELYGKEKQAVEAQGDAVLRQPESVLRQKPEESRQSLDDVEQKLKGLRDKVKGMITETIPGTDLELGNPPDCEDCGSKEEVCDCFTGMSRPQVILDLKQKVLKILFKREDWGTEEREAFLEAMRVRAHALYLKGKK